MKVDTQSAEYTENIEEWTKNRDASKGQEAIKKKTTTYLPDMPGFKDYKGYLARAQYTNFTGRTLETAVGQVFRKDPVIEGIKDEYKNEIDTEGRSLLYFSKHVFKEMQITNRVGVMVDYSKEQERPYLSAFAAEEIINIQVSTINNKKQISRVVISGMREKNNPENRYEKIKTKGFLELFLEDGIYKTAQFEETKDGIKQVGEDVIPYMNNQPMKFIPFYPVTNIGITTKITRSAMSDFANVNLGHYKNSADYENMLHITGAKTVVTKGFSEEVVPIGSAFDVGTDGDAFYLEASSDSGLKDELRHKEEQMSAMGSAYISGQGRYIASAETARITSGSENATLADNANSFSDSMTKIMTVFNEWAGEPTEDVNIKYNTDYDIAVANSQDLVAWSNAVSMGQMSFETYFYNMQKKEVYKEGWTIEDEKKAILADKESNEIEFDDGLDESEELENLNEE